jgi:hypothetical protein
MDFSREEFAQTLAVRATVRGRAPVVVDDHHVVCVDRGGMKVSLFTNDNSKFPTKTTFEVPLICLHIFLNN